MRMYVFSTLLPFVIMSDGEELTAEDFFFLTQNIESNNVENNLNLDDVEKNTILRAVNMHNGNISKAAKELGLTRASLYRRLEKHGL